MLSKVVSAFLGLLAPLIMPVSHCLTGGGELQIRLNTRVHEYHLEARGLADALTRVASDFKIPIGVEWVSTNAAKPKLTLHWKDATVLEIVEGVVKTQPEYEVQIKNNAVHVYSSRLVPERQNFLRLRVNQFKVNNVPVELASRKLRELAKLTVSPPKKEPGREAGGVAGSLITNVGDPKISLQLSNVTVQDVLDGLAVASARKIWIVTFSHSPALTSTGFRRTLTLWNDFPIPDEEQPVWDMFRWGEHVPPIKSP